MGCSCGETTGGSYLDDCPYLTASYILAGLSMMLNIRLAYSSAPYALIRFRLPENLFSVFVRRMASALEFWCLPSMLMGNIIEIAQRLSAESKDSFKLDHSKQQSDNNQNENLGKLIVMKHWKYNFIIIPSMLTMWSDFITYLVLLIVYVTGGDTGNVTAYYFVIAISGFIFGINMVLVYAADWRYIPVYIAGENSFPMLTSIIHYITTLMFGNRRKWNSDFIVVNIDISVAIIISLVTATMWTYSYEILKHDSPAKKFRFNVLPGPFGTADPYGIEGNPRSSSDAVNLNNSSNSFTSKATITITRGEGNQTELSALQLGSGNLQISISSGTIKNSNGSALQINTSLNADTKLSLNAGGEITKPAASGQVTLKGTIVVISDGQQIGTPLSITGGPDLTGVSGSLTLKNESTTHVTITGSLTINKTAYDTLNKTPDTLTIGTSTPRVPTQDTGVAQTLKLNTDEYFQKYWHLLPSDKYDSSDTPESAVASPTLMVIVGMGFVYCIYPGIAPGMIVPFYLVDKIETVLLVLTTFPPVIIAILQKHKQTWSPKTINKQGRFQGWKDYKDYDEKTDVYGQIWHVFDILMIIKMTLLVIFIYCLHYRDSNLSRSIVNQPKMSTFLTIVFYMCHECLLALGFAGVIGNNGATYVVLPAQYVGALFMIFLAFYSEGYIIEYKSHDPAHWPTEGMTKWNAFCYWCKRASKITNHNLRSLFTTDLRRDLLLCIQKNELI